MSETAAPDLPERLQALAQSVEDDLDPRMADDVLETSAKMIFDLREASRLLLEMGREYRVVWKREGQARKRKLYQTRDGAVGFISNVLTVDPEELPEDDGAWHRDRETFQRMTAPFEEGPLLEARAVSGWVKA